MKVLYKPKEAPLYLVPLGPPGPGPGGPGPGPGGPGPPPGPPGPPGPPPGPLEGPYKDLIRTFLVLTRSLYKAFRTSLLNPKGGPF